MSFQAVQKVRRNASPLNSRQPGPVKATLPFSYPAVTVGCFSNSDIQHINSVKISKKPSPDRFTNSPASRGMCHRLFTFNISPEISCGSEVNLVSSVLGF
jgi:hypothetical protein